MNGSITDRLAQGVDDSVAAPGQGWQHFSTDVLAPRDRFSAFCEEIMRRQVALDAIRRKGLPFDARISAYGAGHVDITRVTTSEASYVRTPALMRDGSDDVFAVLCLEGGLRSTQGDGHRRIGPGEGMMCDSAETGGLHMETTTRYWAMRIPRAHLSCLLPRAARFGGAVLDRDGLSLRLLSGYLDTLYTANAASRERALMGGHMVDLVALALGAEAVTSHGAERAGLRAARLEAVLRAIDANSGDPELSAATVAAQLGVTPRYVHLLLEKTGRTFSQHLLARRLDRALWLLRDQRHGHLRIGDIAGEAGFADLSYFNRSFRRHFGDTPSAVRSRLRSLS